MTDEQKIKEKFERRNKLSAEEKLLDERPTAEEIVNNLSHFYEINEIIKKL